MMAQEKKDPNENREGYELYESKWQKVINGDRSGWWRFHGHYDQYGYCDNPARGY
jgi:hypothetical protein